MERRVITQEALKVLQIHMSTTSFLFPVLIIPLVLVNEVVEKVLQILWDQRDQHVMGLVEKPDEVKVSIVKLVICNIYAAGNTYSSLLLSWQLLLCRITADSSCTFAKLYCIKFNIDSSLLANCLLL